MKKNKKELQLPKGFSEFTQARQEGFIKMKQLKESGARVVGVYCTYTPLEIIYAANLIPVSLCSSSNDAISYAEVDLPKNLCPLVKASYGVAVSDTCPYFYFADLIVGETTCDGKKKMYELMNKIKDTYSVMTPNNKRFDELSLLIDEYRVDGVIEIVLQACHTFAIEATSVSRFVSEKKKMPYMYIESDYSMNDFGQISTRIEAFVEMLGS